MTKQQWVPVTQTTFRLGAQTFSIDGPGQSPRPGSCARMGKLVGFERNRWGAFAVVAWEGEARPEQVALHCLRPADPDKHAIGVYVATEKELF